jgi:hypothetical protein
MKETPQEYIKRILSYVTGQDKELDRLIKAAPASRLHQRPAPGKCSIAEILAQRGVETVGTSSACTRVTT